MSTHVTIKQTAQIMAELNLGTDPNFLQALRAAGMSPRMNLGSNAGYNVATLPWRDQPLPERGVLIEALSKAKRADGRPAYGLMKSHVDTLYAVDAFWFGLSPEWREAVQTIGVTLDEQRAWRCRMNSLIHGMAFKCLSWAAAIYSPEQCQLLTLDTWHARRLGVDPAILMRDNEASHSLYERLETQVIDEVNRLFPEYPSTVGAACLWFNVRGKGPESHAGLSCRVQEVQG